MSKMTKLKERINVAFELIEGITHKANKLNDEVGLQAIAVKESALATRKMIDTFKSTSDLSLQQLEEIGLLFEKVTHIEWTMKDTIQAVQDISQSMDSIDSAIKVLRSITTNTNLMSMKEAIQATRAGATAHGFDGTMARLINTLGELHVGRSEVAFNMAALRELTSSFQSQLCRNVFFDGDKF